MATLLREDEREGRPLARPSSVSQQSLPTNNASERFVRKLFRKIIWDAPQRPRDVRSRDVAVGAGDIAPAEFVCDDRAGTLRTGALMIQWEMNRYPSVIR